MSDLLPPAADSPAAPPPVLPSLLPPAVPHTRRPPAAWWLVCLLTAGAYWLIGKAALQLAILPGFASPLFPSAGLALAVVLVQGWRALPGVMLGAFALHVPLGPALALMDLPSLELSSLGLPLLVGTGAALQAAAGAALVRRWLPGPLRLGEAREVALFYALGAVLSCTVNASLSTTGLVLAGVVPLHNSAFTWWTWWGGDTLGVLIGAPIVLTLIGRPRADWAPRRLTLGLPLLLTTALLAVAIFGVARWDNQRSQNSFERDAAAAGAALDADLHQALYALEAIHGLFIGSDDVSADEMRMVAQPWLDLPIQLRAVGYGVHVPRSDVPRFEAQVSRERGQPYRVFDRTGANGLSPAVDDAAVTAIRYIEPLAVNSEALGVNSLSVPAARDAINRAVATDAPAASAGFALTQEPGQHSGVVIYRALYRGNPAPADRVTALRGVVFVTLRMRQSAAAAMHAAPSYLRWCLLDANPAAAQRRLAGADGCIGDDHDHGRRAGSNAKTHTLHHDRWLAIGGQQWLLRIDANQAQMPDAGYANVWLFSTVGLLSAAMLAALLLLVTGRNRVIEVAVEQRTADLQREVLEHQRTESALRESEQRVRNIFDHAPIGIVYADLAGRVREANPHLRALIGAEADTLAQSTLAALIHADDWAAVEHDLASLLRGEAVDDKQRRSRLRQQGGHTLWVRMRWSLLRGPDGLPQRLVAVIEDITERVLREEAERGRQHAESANEAKNEFLSRMSHELRTPLNAMLGFGQLLDLDLRPRLAQHQRSWVAHVLSSGWHLLEMINDTLDLSRIDAGMMRLSMVPVDLAPLVAACVTMIGPAAAKRNITLAVSILPAARHTTGDETRLKQVLSNLLSNAVKYNSPGGQVSVTTRLLDDQRLQVRVHDTGLGLRQDQLADLFQPFNRLGHEKTDTEGTGIGLVISRRLAELMGGTLHAESEPGSGATFVLTFPLAPSQPDASAPAPGIDPEAQRYGLRRVHYVEDNETNVEVMRGMLLQRPQITLDVSGLGLDGLLAIRAQQPDLVLLDMHLPDIDGLELLRQLQADPGTANIPVVVVSADAIPAQVDEALAAGARHYLTKPVNLASLLSVLDELLEALDTRWG